MNVGFTVDPQSVIYGSGVFLFFLDSSKNRLQVRLRFFRLGVGFCIRDELGEFHLKWLLFGSL